jgi:hypothetical protein
MTMLPALSRSSLLQTLLNRTSKRLCLIVTLALITTGAGAIASISSYTMASYFFSATRNAGEMVQNAPSSLGPNRLVFAALAATPADGQLNVARHGHAASLLNDGKVLVTGGENAGGFVAVAEVFDPAGGGFSVSGNLSTPRADHTATRLVDGRVLVAGGRGAPGPLNSTEIFDPTTGAFTTGPPLMRARSGHTATVLTTGLIVLAGGDTTGSLEIYDPALNAFVLDSANMLTPRAKHAAALMQDGRIFFVGGNDLAGNGLTSAEVFDLANRSLSAAGNGMEHDRVQPFLRVLHDGKIQIIGGTHDDSIEIYNPVADVFGAHGHLIPVDDPHAALLLDDILHAPTRAALFHEAQVDFLFDRHGHTITELTGSNEALIVGGANSGGSALSSFLALSGSATTISTDKLDYTPGQTALITGTAWQPGETVDIVMHEDPHTHTERRLSVVADGEGKISGSYFVEQHDSNVHFVVGAKGLTSGWTAQTAFTDTDPTPQTIPYSQDFSALPHSGDGSTTYPPGWQGWQLLTSGSSTSFRTSAPTGDLGLIAGSSASTATGGVHNYNGKTGVLATGSSDPSLALAVNTTGQSNLTMSFDIMTIRNPYDGGSNTRIAQVDLQYRVGTIGSFTSLSSLTNGIYQNNTTTQTGAGVTTPQKSENKSFILPTAVNNQAVVQLRWVQRDVSGGGSRPSFAIDNVVITVLSPGSLQFGEASYSDPETNSGTHTRTITVQRTGGSGGAVDVSYATSDGTATIADDDYFSSSGTLHWNDGDSAEQTFSILVKGDTTCELDETVNLTLSDPTGGASIGGTNPATLTIINDDSVPEISIDDVTHNESDTSTTSFDFTISLSNASYQTVTVDYATANDTATAPSDYASVPSTNLSFLPGETSKLVSVIINGDNTFEGDEMFTITLDSPTNSIIADGTGLGTIQNDDSQPTVQFVLASSSGAESASLVELVASLSNDSYETVTVNYIVNGSSTSSGGGTDYTLANGTLNFNPGETTGNISVTVNDDLLYEDDETVVVALSTPTNATLASQATHTYTIQDNDVAPNFTINDVTVTEGNTGTTDFIFTVNKIGQTALTASVDYATANGMSNASTGSVACGPGIDYESRTGTLGFAPADTTMTITIKVCGDTVSETGETFFVNLSNAIKATISDNQGLGMIANDDSLTYNFEGFFAPVDNPPIVNTAKAGSAVPINWRLTTSAGAPVSDPNNVLGLFSYEVNCGTTDGLEAPVETVASGSSGLQYKGDGNWQINWKTLLSYPRGSCRLLELRLNDGTSHYANFKFK